ncbi:MAG: hypothetical protein NDJ92_06400 [Thermoanaerobaculia bacterium]|nr:hypothetical protein [Thermoanaerobaculia bacterium]
MHILAAVLALLLLVIVLSPIVMGRFRLARRERAVHLGGSCHWYANYDEELRYEPRSGADIVRVLRDDVLRRGYAPTSEVQVVPRTFRHRVPGDSKIRLWKNGDVASPPLWLCEWAMNPVRVSIGVGDRESVAGVESGRVPTVAEFPPAASPPTLDPGEWAADLPSALSPVDGLGLEGPPAALAEPLEETRVADEAASGDDAPPGDVADETDGRGKVEFHQSAGAGSSVPEGATSDVEGRRRSRRRRRRR